MLWKEPLFAFIVIVGFVLFLYGANYYDAVVGWTGFGLFVGGILAYVALRTYDYASKKGAS